MIGGWITDTLNWHWLFYVNLVPEPGDHRAGATAGEDRQAVDLSLIRDADYPGIVLMAVGLGTA